ncbi:Glutactin, partial [Pseudolycoriella hygida]
LTCQNKLDYLNNQPLQPKQRIWTYLLKAPIKLESSVTVKYILAEYSSLLIICLTYLSFQFLLIRIIRKRAPSMGDHRYTLKTWVVATLIIAAISKCNSSDLFVQIPNVGNLLYTHSTSTWSSNVIYQFRAVRFAESPTGNKRFKAPVPAEERNGTQNLPENGEPCPSISSVSNMTLEQMTIAEDCLHLSIYTRNLSESQPVMVYIHGGAFYEGAAAHHPPNYLLEKNIVLVVPQYRLGPLGFLSTETDAIPGNVAVMDVILALQWVQKHITHFGGSNASVTLFGQSAGASLIASLLYSPFTPAGLFHKVILQSGTAFNTWSFDRNAKENARDIARLAGCTDDVIVENLNNCFKDMDVKTMLTAFWTHALKKGAENIALYGGAKFTYGPLSQIFPVPPEELDGNVAYQNIPILAGITKHDGSYMLTSFYDSLSAEEMSNNEYLSRNLVQRVNRFPDNTGVLTSYQRDLFFSRDIVESGNFTKFINGIIDIMSVVMFKGPILKLFQSRSIAENLYLYSFDYEGEFTRFGYGADTSHYPFKGGIHHSNDNIYVFPYPSFASKLNGRDTIMAKTMVDFWTSFATNGRPTSMYCPNWPAFSTKYGPYLHIDEKCTIGMDFIEEFNIANREEATSKSTISYSWSLSLFLVALFGTLLQS